MSATFKYSGLRILALLLLAVLLVDCGPPRHVHRAKRKRKPKCKTCPSFSEAHSPD